MDPPLPHSMPQVNFSIKTIPALFSRTPPEITQEYTIPPVAQTPNPYLNSVPFISHILTICKIDWAYHQIFPNLTSFPHLSVIPREVTVSLFGKHPIATFTFHTVVI